MILSVGSVGYLNILLFAINLQGGGDIYKKKDAFKPVNLSVLLLLLEFLFFCSEELSGNFTSGMFQKGCNEVILIRKMNA